MSEPKSKQEQEEYDLKQSEAKIGQLYPILEAKDGDIIDGLHREEANKNWKRVRLDHIDTEEKKLIARLVANFNRRQVSYEEKRESFNRLAKAVSPTLKKGEYTKKIAELTGISPQTVRKYLDEKYKDMSQSRGPGSVEYYVQRETEAIKRQAEEEFLDRLRDWYKRMPERRVQEAIQAEINLRKEEDEVFKQKTEGKSFYEILGIEKPEEKNPLEEIGIPPVSEQIEAIYAKRKPFVDTKEEWTQEDAKQFIVDFAKRHKLSCPVLPPITDETELPPIKTESTTKIVCPKCGHNFNIGEAEIL